MMVAPGPVRPGTLPRSILAGQMESCQVSGIRCRLAFAGGTFDIVSLITRFEDVQAWQEARKLTRSIYQLVENSPLRQDFGLKDQIQRAAVSSMANIAEGFDCESKVEFARFLGIARRSVVEVQSLLYVALDNGCVSEQIFRAHYAQAAKTKALIGGFKKALLRRST
jgi:four helix bundle protein